MHGQPIHDIMKLLNDIVILYRSNRFRNYSIFLGVILSLFLVFSLRNDNITWKQSSINNLAAVEQNIDEQSQKVVEVNPQEKYSSKYHNFLASYFLQESSVDRSKKKSEEKSNVISNLKDLHHLIISRSWSAF